MIIYFFLISVMRKRNNQLSYQFKPINRRNVILSINSPINQHITFCWTTFHHFQSGSSIRANSAVVCLRESELDTSCAPGIIPRNSFRSLPSFSRRYSFADPLRRPDYVPRDTDRFLPRFPYRIFIGRSSAALGDIKHDTSDRASALHSEAP